jgi:hypothetical protein
MTSRLSTLHRAVVTDVADPLLEGRVKIDAVDAGAVGWAPVAVLGAHGGSGRTRPLHVGDLVFVGFEHGDPTMPVVLGACTPAGGAVTPDPEDVELTTAAGQRITLSATGTVQVDDGNGNEIVLEPSGITIRAAAKVTVEASQVDVTAAMVSVDAGMAKFSGVVECQTLVATSVVAASYTPGAGNLW